MIRILVLGSFLSLLLTSTVAWSEPKSCTDLLVEVQAIIQSPGDAATIEETKLHLDSTITVQSESPGRHGGKLLKVRKIGSSWTSSFASTVGKFDPQGDPRWFIELLGVEAAKFFGFEVLSDTQMTVPNITEFQNAIAKVNEDLKSRNLEEIAIRYYQAASNENSNVKNYTDQFLNNFGLPMAPSGNHLFHDLSFHTGAIFLPQKVLAYKAAQLAYHKDFVAHLRGKYTDATSVSAINYIEYHLNLLNTVDIDNGSGFIGLGLLAYIKNPSSRFEPENYIAMAWDYLIPPIGTPASDLEERLRVILGNLDPETPSERWIKHKPAFDRMPLQTDLRDFNKTYKSNLSRGFDIHGKFTVPDGSNIVDFICSQITRRRLIVLQSVLRLQK